MAIPFTPYPYVPPQYQDAPVKRAGDALQSLIQQFAALKQQQTTTDMARQQKILDFAKAADENGQEFIDRFKSLGGQIPGSTTATTGGGFWNSLLHGLPSPSAANPAPPTLTSQSLAPNQAMPRTPTSATTFTPTEKEDAALQSLPSEHPDPNAALVPPPMATPATPAAVPATSQAAAAPALSQPAVAPAAPPPGPLKPTDITPEYMANLKKQKGSKGVKEFIDQQKFVTEQGKDQNAIQQNAPTTYAGAEAILNPYGDDGAKVLAGLKTAYPNGQIPKFAITDALTSLSGAAKSDFFGNMGQIRKAQLRQSLVKDALDAINPYFQSGPGKDQVSRLQSIGRLEPLIGQMLGQQNGGNPQQMRELATAFNKVLVGSGVGAEGQIDALVPQTARGKFANWQQWLTNSPQGTEQQAFIHQIADSVAREKQAITSQIQQQAEATSPVLRSLKELYPLDHQAVLNSVMKNPQFMPAAPGQPGVGTTVAPPPPASDVSAKLADAQAWLAANPNDPRSAAVRQRVMQLQGGR